MDLIIESSDICCTRIFSGNSNEPIYDIATDFKFLSQAPTIIYKYDGEKRYEIGRIEWPTWTRSHTNITCRGQQIHMESPGIFTQSKVYKAPDGLSYKWKIDGEPILRKDDASKELVAAYSPKSSIFSRDNRPGMVKVAPDGIAILDELVITFVYFEKKRRDSRQAAAISASTNTTMVATTGY